MGLRLNLGCSDRFREGYTNVDICEPADVVCDLELLPWPWDDNSVDEIIADDILEHLWPYTQFQVSMRDPSITATDNAKYPIIALMNEIWRVLAPGGIIRIFIPTTDGRGAFQDPTHRIFVNRNTFYYFEDGNPHRERFAKAYGIIARFRVLSEDERDYGDKVTKLTIELQAIK